MSQIPVNNGTGRHLQRFFRPVIGNFREVPVAKHIFLHQTAAILEPFRIEGGDRLDIGQVNVLHKFNRLLGDIAHIVHGHFIDHVASRAGIVHVDRASHTTDQVIRMRVLAAQNRMNLDDFTLEIKCL